MKKLFFILLCGLMGAATLNAQTWQIGSPNAADVTATLENGTLTISGTGNVQNWNSSGDVPWDNDRTSINMVIIEEGIYSFNSTYLAFWNCTALTSIEVAEANSVFSSDDGVLYNKNKTTQILCPPKTGSNHSRKRSNH